MFGGVFFVFFLKVFRSPYPLLYHFPRSAYVSVLYLSAWSLDFKGIILARFPCNSVLSSTISTCSWSWGQTGLCKLQEFATCCGRDCVWQWPCLTFWSCAAALAGAPLVRQGGSSTCPWTIAPVVLLEVQPARQLLLSLFPCLPSTSLFPNVPISSLSPPSTGSCLSLAVQHHTVQSQPWGPCPREQLRCPCASQTGPGQQFLWAVQQVEHGGVMEDPWR